MEVMEHGEYPTVDIASGDIPSDRDREGEIPEMRIPSGKGLSATSSGLRFIESAILMTDAYDLFVPSMNGPNNTVTAKP